MDIEIPWALLSEGENRLAAARDDFTPERCEEIKWWLAAPPPLSLVAAAGSPDCDGMSFGRAGTQRGKLLYLAVGLRERCFLLNSFIAVAMYLRSNLG